MSQTEYAPLPWSYRRMRWNFAIEAANGVRVAEVRYVGRPDGSTSEDQAKAIVDAVNALQFECCGGNDETPKDHCMDCPARSEEELRQAAINAGETP